MSRLSMQRARVLAVFATLAVITALASCNKKKEVPTSSGGGDSTQSVMTVKGAGR